MHNSKRPKRQVSCSRVAVSTSYWRIHKALALPSRLRHSLRGQASRNQVYQQCIPRHVSFPQMGRIEEQLPCKAYGSLATKI